MQGRCPGRGLPKAGQRVAAATAAPDFRHLVAARPNVIAPPDGYTPVVSLTRVPQGSAALVTPSASSTA